ncbi:Calcium-binding protein E63-1 [Eumeta japonica]|uniref:Calcium-binding protein E63-1 n=1 Tax=Eumeta variegata TaxID=151549 RepID=A0A4C1U9V2_EUMVA|nr:Calcium-binding protein E63-1 [Eumeta japonica]
MPGMHRPRVFDHQAPFHSKPQSLPNRIEIGIKHQLRCSNLKNRSYHCRVFDRDDNGYITRDELRAALEMIGEPVTDAQLNQVLALGDIDHDGRIDYEGTTTIINYLRS